MAKDKFLKKLLVLIFIFSTNKLIASEIGEVRNSVTAISDAKELPCPDLTLPVADSKLLACPHIEEENAYQSNGRYKEGTPVGCRCLVEISKEEKESYKKVADKQVGDVFANYALKLRSDLDSALNVFEVAGINPATADKNRCSGDYMHKLLQASSDPDSKDGLHCSLDKMTINAQKYFNLNTKPGSKPLEFYKEMYGKFFPEVEASSSSVFFKVFDPDNTKQSFEDYSKQCLSEPAGHELMQSLMKSSALDKNFRKLQDLFENQLNMKGKASVDFERLEKNLIQQSAFFRMLPSFTQKELMNDVKIGYESGKGASALSKNFIDQLQTPEIANKAVAGVQRQCSFMMTSLHSLLCNDDLDTVSTNEDLQKKLFGYSPEAFEDEPLDEFGLEEMEFLKDIRGVSGYVRHQQYCESKKRSNDQQNRQQESHDPNAVKCQKSFTMEDDSLLASASKFNSFDQFLACADRLSGGDTSYIASNAQSSFDDHSENNSEGRVNTCSILACSNYHTPRSVNKSFKCIPRTPPATAVLTALKDLAQINCSGVSRSDGRFCTDGIPKPELGVMQKMIIRQCKVLKCMSAEELLAQFEPQIKSDPTLKEFIEEDVEASISIKRDFWERFDGDYSKSVRAATSQKQLNDYIKGFDPGRGYRKPARNENLSVIAEAAVVVADAVLKDTPAAAPPTDSDEDPDSTSTKDEEVINADAGDRDPAKTEELEAAGKKREKEYGRLTDAQRMAEQVKFQNSAMDTLRELEELEARKTMLPPTGSKVRDELITKLDRKRAEYDALQDEYDRFAKATGGKDFESEYGDMVDGFSGLNPITTGSNYRDLDKSPPSFAGSGSTTFSNVNSPFSGGGYNNPAANSAVNNADTGNNNIVEATSLPKRDVSGGTSSGNSGITAGAGSGAVSAGAGNGSVAQLGVAGQGGGGAGSVPAVQRSAPDMDALAKQMSDSIGKEQYAGPFKDAHLITITEGNSKIDLEGILLRYSKRNPKFRVGLPVEIKSKTRNGTPISIRLTPEFDGDNFVRYGVFGDSVLRKRLNMKSNVISFRELSPGEAMDVLFNI